MAVQVSNGLIYPPPPPGQRLLTQSPAEMSVAQAKANLLALGEESHEEAHTALSIPSILGKIMLLVPLLAPLIWLGITRAMSPKTKAKPQAHDRGGPRAGSFAGLGLSLGMLLRLARPVLPIILRYFAHRRESKSAARQNQRHVRAAAVR